MVNRKGSLTILTLLTMVIILVSALLLLYTSNLEYLIVNSTINNIQGYYMAEAKIDMVLYNDDYYYKEILPRIETYIEYKRISPFYSHRISLDEKDLLEGDEKDLVLINFFDEEERMVMELEVDSRYRNINNRIIARVTLLNDFFEMGLPIISKADIPEDKIPDYEEYMEYLQNHIKIPSVDRDIVGVEANNYEEIIIKKDLDSNTYIELYRNNIEKPIKKEIIPNNKLFLLAQKNSLTPTILTIKSENSLDRMVMEGVLYIEGDLAIRGHMDFNGIFIINGGNLLIDPSAELEFQGLIFLIDPVGEIELGQNLPINYNLGYIRRYGIYLPRFIDPRVKLVKVK